MAPPTHSIFSADQDFDDMARLVSDSFGVDAPTLTFLIKSDGKGRVAKGEWQGRPVIVKEIYARDRPEAIAMMEAEHDRLRGLFPHGALHFVDCLATAPRQGLVILPFAPGLRLDDALRMAVPNQRHEMVKTAVGWLVHSMQGQRELGSFSPGYWIGILKGRIAKTALNADDARLLGQLVQHLERLARALSGGPVPRGPSHGDYSSQNMFWDTATGDLHVFDVQRHRVMPVSMDLTRLLCDLTYKHLCDAPNAALDRGHVAQYRQVAMSVPGLDHPDDPGGFMDFATGLRHGIVLLGKIDNPLGPVVRDAMRHWLATVPSP